MPSLDVVARDDEVLAVVGDAAHDDVDVGMLGVPVIDGDPIELGAEVLLHLADQLAGEALEVGHLGGVLGRDDEAEMMAVILAALGEGLRIGVVGLGSEQPRLLAVPGDALAPQIAEMGRERRARRALWRTTRVLTVSADASGRSAAGWPARWRPGRGRSVERRPLPIVPLARDADRRRVWAAASAWAMKGLARWLARERMRPGRRRKSFSLLMAQMSREVRFSLKGLRNCRVRGLHNAGAHRGAGTKTLARNNAPTVPRPGRTLRPFILPSDGRLPLPPGSHFCAGLRNLTMITTRSIWNAQPERRTNRSRSCDGFLSEAREPTGKGELTEANGRRAAPDWRVSGFGLAAETWTNSPSDCGAMADRGTATTGASVGRRFGR